MWFLPRRFSVAGTYSNRSSSRQMFVNLARLIDLSLGYFLRLLMRSLARSLIYRVAVFYDRLSKKMLLILLFATKSND